MLNKLQKRKNDQKGFTIIEVLIVLAIAGLILLIVLLAVPALQRNSRNTAIKNDASAIAGGISEFASNNDGGSIGAGSSALGSTVTLDNTALTNHQATTAKTQSSTVVTFVASGTITAITPVAGSIYVVPGTKCGTPAGTSSGALIASARGTSVVYATENPGSLAARCTDS